MKIKLLNIQKKINLIIEKFPLLIRIIALHQKILDIKENFQHIQVKELLDYLV